MIREALTVFRLYRWHSRRYALQAVWRIAVRGNPF